jgi:hypothetical protein
MMALERPHALTRNNYFDIRTLDRGKVPNPLPLTEATRAQDTQQVRLVCQPH